MAWNDQNTRGLIGGGAGALAGGGLLLGSDLIAGGVGAALAPWTGGASLAAIPFMSGGLRWLGGGLLATGAGTTIGAGLDAASSEPQYVEVPDELQELINRGNQASIVRRLLEPGIHDLAVMPDPYRINPYLTPAVALPGASDNVQAGLAQLPGLYADEAAKWQAARARWQQDILDKMLNLYRTQTDLGGQANDTYVAAQKLAENIRQGNEENQLARQQLSGARIRAGAKVGSIVGNLLGGVKWPETPTIDINSTMTDNLKRLEPVFEGNRLKLPEGVFSSAYRNKLYSGTPYVDYDATLSYRPTPLPSSVMNYASAAGEISQRPSGIRTDGYYYTNPAFGPALTNAVKYAVPRSRPGIPYVYKMSSPLLPRPRYAGFEDWGAPTEQAEGVWDIPWRPLGPDRTDPYYPGRSRWPGVLE